MGEDMLGKSKKRGPGGVKRTISKKEDRAKRQHKALAVIAKEKGIMSVKGARRILEGKKRTLMRPNGRESARTKKIRVFRQKRERRGYSVKTEWSDDGESFSGSEQ